MERTRTTGKKELVPLFGKQKERKPGICLNDGVLKFIKFDSISASQIQNSVFRKTKETQNALAAVLVQSISISHYYQFLLLKIL